MKQMLHRSNECKQIQDPIYGYINLPNEYIPIIDSAEFQRLRNIRQTGYDALYPSALHNRFVHSLGVFYLGTLAFDYFEKNVKKDDDDILWDQYRNTFYLACLLHDVGHAPFSHTGEYFYHESTDFIEEISALVSQKGSSLSEDMSHDGYGKEHEAMSVIVGIELLKNVYDGDIDKELFARCIMGILYRGSESYKETLLNAIIRMLNGSLIDVDKIDYLRRDAYVTGYSSMAIDYDRILAGYTISKYTNDEGIDINVVSFKRKALSVVENILYANDLERKWIQNNPVILYDCKLVEAGILKFNDYIFKSDSLKEKYKNIFNKTALSSSGFPPDERVGISLLSDDDIICYLKNSNDNEIEQIRLQYFSRKERFKPLWKSEEEYKELIKTEIAENTIKDLCRSIRDATKYPESVFFLNHEELSKRKQSEDTGKARKSAIKLLEFFLKFATENELDFRFAIILGKSFSSNYKKFDNSPIFIEYENGEAKKFNPSLIAPEKKEELLFYVYTSNENIQKFNGREKVRNALIKYVGNRWK